MYLLMFLTPMLTLSAQTMTGGQFSEMRGFAQAVAVSDGNVFIGEPQNVHRAGVVYVFGQSEGEWTSQAELMAPDGEIEDRFGTSLSVDANRIFIGAPGLSGSDGAAYLFENAEGSWSETARMALPYGANGSRFGESVLIHGDHAFVGAPGYNEELGAVFVYRLGDEGWSQTSIIASPDTSAESGFGSTLSFDGSNLAIAAPQQGGGAVYIYSEEGNMWNERTMLTNNQPDSRARFGSAMLMRNSHLFIGSPRENTASGAVYHYQKDEESGNWTQAGRLLAFDGQPRYQFGSSITWTNNGLWIGAPNADGGRGLVYQFSQNEEADGWSGVQVVTLPESSPGDDFAASLAADKSLAVAGLTGADYGAGSAAILQQSESGEWIAQNIVIGTSDAVLQRVTNGRVECQDGQATLFGCDNVDLISFLPVHEIGGNRGVRLNDMWGWTDPLTDREYAIVGRNEGTSFVDVTDPYNPVYIGNLQMPETAVQSVWRDMKVYKDHVFIVADNARDHGMQVLDLALLREFSGEPIEFEETAHYRNIRSAHNIVINEDTGYAYIVGSSGGGETCGGGLHMVNIQDPVNPTFEGCFADATTGRSGTGYSHDAQCVIYDGPDEEHKGKEICIGSNETAISVADVTDKDNPIPISTASYPDYGYVHQGWLTEDHRYFFQNDELDELTGAVDRTRTLVWDLADLDDPQFVREFFIDTPSSDHNLYIKDNLMYQSNYVSGLQVVDVSDPANPKHVASFDTHPFTPDSPGFSGTWSNYPYFKSGIVVMTSGREGLFILDVQPQVNLP